MILVRKKSDNGVWIGFPDSWTVAISSDGVNASFEDSGVVYSDLTDVDYEIVTGVTDTDENYKYGNGIYSWDGSAWTLVDSTLKTKIDVENAAFEAQQPSE
jgi:hypothetical protein|tara:strand:+ start:1737 stop:2039 length:303 start_codon:yes stop_codon:yes gene_type:complete